MSDREACPNCPFRASSAFGYDPDADEALSNDMVPSCHALVGRDSIFHDEAPSPATICVGHERWIEGAPGYRRPVIVTADGVERAL